MWTVLRLTALVSTKCCVTSQRIHNNCARSERLKKIQFCKDKVFTSRAQSYNLLRKFYVFSKAKYVETGRRCLHGVGRK